MSKNKGFTLIEILIVIVIIGITVGFALIAFGDFGESKRILFAAEQFENILHLAQQEAILENNTFGLRIDNKNYQILKFIPPSKWQTSAAKNLYKPHSFPKNMVIKLSTSFKARKNGPSIIIDSSGDLSAFTLTFGSDKEQTIATLTGSENGDLNFTKADPK